jgi:hypothetical protein
MPRLLRVKVLHQLHRALDVREQRRDSLLSPSASAASAATPPALGEARVSPQPEQRRVLPKNLNAGGFRSWTWGKMTGNGLVHCPQNFI